MLGEYDVIVVGAGHAGNEAAAAAANLGQKTLLITMNMATIGQMSCNPAMGGIAKGQIVKEIDAMGGLSGIISDLSAIQFKMLNRSKGPAMWSPRTQNDRFLFGYYWRMALEKIQNLDFWQDTVVDLVIENQKIKGVITALGVKILSKTVILTNGTFLNGIIHIGTQQIQGGRSAEKAATGLTAVLEKNGFVSGRMKTGTPPRVDGRSLDYSKMEIQPGDENPEKFSFSEKTQALKKQLPCYMSYTNETVHEILATGFEKSPMFTGRIKGLGPRYCPSIEDKIIRFADKQRHQIFVEPEGWETTEIYVNGFSSSLPQEVQYEALKQIPGFEKAKMLRAGYAIEYDFFPPTQLLPSLETKNIEGLFFAGQINGTTGYEEAAAQGFIAGINAAQKNQEKEALILKRSEAYIGVLIDDLVFKGTDEPYRMFTSRAEYRVLLRGDNADERLTPIAHQIGLVDEKTLEKVIQKQKNIEEIKNHIEKINLSPEEINPYLEQIGDVPISEKYKAIQILLRPKVDIHFLSKNSPTVAEKIKDYPAKDLEAAEIAIKYKWYIEKEKETVEKFLQLEKKIIPSEINYDKIPSLSIESKEKLKKNRPNTLGQAQRISGISPADIQVLWMYMNR